MSTFYFISRSVLFRLIILSLVLDWLYCMGRSSKIGD